MTDFQPIETQEELDRIIQGRIARLQKQLDAEKVKSTENRLDRDTWKRDARRWETRAKSNLAVMRAHETTIKTFIDKLDDVLTEGE